MLQVKIKKIKISIADEQPVIQIGLRTILASFTNVEVTQCCSSGDELLQMLCRNEEQLDILLTDFSFTQGSNDDGLRLIRKVIDSGKVKDIFIFTDVRCAWTLRKLLQLGVSCLLSKRDDISEQVKTAMAMARRKKIWLSPYIQMLLNQVSGCRAFSSNG